MTIYQREMLVGQIESCHRQLRFASRSICHGVPEAALIALSATAILVEQLRHACDDETCCAALCRAIDDVEEEIRKES